MTPEQFRAWLDRHALSRQQAADALGVSRRTIEGWLRCSQPCPIPEPIAKLTALMDQFGAQEKHN